MSTFNVFLSHWDWESCWVEAFHSHDSRQSSDNGYQLLSRACAWGRARDSLAPVRRRVSSARTPVSSVAQLVHLQMIQFSEDL